MTLANQELTALIHAHRNQLGVTRKRAARQLGITEGYLAHLERVAGRPVHISDRLAAKLLEVLRIHKTPLSHYWAMVADQNRRTQKYYARFKKTP